MAHRIKAVTGLMCGVAMPVPASRRAMNDKVITAGMVSSAGRYQLLTLIRLKSNDRARSLRRRAGPASRETTMAAASMGQKVASAATGRPGSSCTSVDAPTSQKGMARTKARMKNNRTRRWVLLMRRAACP